MKQIPGNLTAAQLKVYEVVQRIRMAWVALLFVVIPFAFGVFAFLYAIFFLPQQEVAKGILGGINLLLGWALKIILNNLFPSKGGGN